MKKMKRIISWMLTFVMVLSICQVPFTVSASERTANDCISELIAYYKNYQESAATDIERVLDELKTIDEAAYEDWKEIMDFWSFANTDMEVSIGVGPDGMPEDDSLCIVVLGFALNADGTMKEELINRLKVGLATAEKYPNAYVAVTGGGTAANNPDVTEGGLMGEWMLEQGLDPDRLIVENRAPSTVGNALMTYTLLVEEYPMVDSVCMVTSDYHVPRGCIIFNSKFILAGTEAGTKPIDIVGYAGCDTGSNGYESISLQASGVSQVAGVSAAKSVTLSKVTALTVTTNDDLSMSVEAAYDSGYVRDVTDAVKVTGLNEALGKNQEVLVSYTENDVTVSGYVNLADDVTKVTGEIVISDRTANECIADLIGYYKNYQESAATDIERVLAELRTIDGAAYEDWKEIMDFWSFANTDMEVSIGVGPDGMPEDDSLCIVVLGFALNADGTMKEELINRLKVGLATAEKYPNAYVAVTGGGTAANNPDVTEGGLMGEWMLEQGLDPDRLIVENRAPSTVGNALMTYTLLVEEYPMVDSVCMVTSDYHVPRGCIIFNSKFVLAATEAGTKPISIVGYAGCDTGSNGYESISLQASGVSQVAGVSASSDVVLSVLTGLSVKADVVDNALDLTVKASYDSDYVRDVSELAVVEGFDASLGTNQTITVTYTENGITLGGAVNLSDGTTEFAGKEHLGNLISDAEAMNLATYTSETVAVFNDALAAAKAVYESDTATVEEVEAVYNALNAAIAGLKVKLNIAYGAKVTANCNQSNAYKIVDGSTSNYWESVESGANVNIADTEVVIDLNGVCEVDSINVIPYNGDGRYYAFDVFVSADGENWELVAEERPTSEGTAEGYTYAFDEVKTISYVKIEGVSVYHPTRPDITNFHLKEVFVYGKEIGNIALEKPVRSSGSDQSAASSAGAAENKANDGNRKTYWDAGKYANLPWIIVELGDVYDLEKVNVINYISTSRHYKYEVYTSVNGVDYELLAVKDSEDVSVGWGYEHDATGVKAAFIKVVGTYNSSNSAFHIAEIRAYGEVVAVDKAALTELVYACNDINKDLYKPETLPAFETALTAAHIVMNDEHVTQLDVEKALYNLKASVEGLVELTRVEKMVASMSLRDKVTQMLMVDFRYWDEDLTDDVAQTGFTVMNDQVAKVIEGYNFGALIYFAQNLTGTEQAYKLTKAVQEAATKDGGIPLIISADQEGGSVYRLATGTALPGNMALGATGSTEYAYKAGQIIGSELSVLGINTNLAPVVDVNNNANNPVIGLRSYGDDATTVGQMAAATIQGLAEYNVIGCAKHFPGHGDTATDSHYGLPIVDKSLDVLLENELKPYEVAIEEGIEMIMTAHILYPQLESDTIVSEKTGNAESLPATMSDDILTGLLKGDMGFEGIIVTDAMNMAGISANWDQVQSVKIAIAAGVDMICMPCTLYNLEDLADLDAIIEGVVAAVESGEIPESRLDDAVTRILTVKENRGILDYNAEDYTLENALETVGSDENRATEREIAAAAVTVIKNENNVLPLDITADTNVLMLVPYNNESAQMLMGWNRAVEAGIIPEGAEVDYYRFSSSTFNATLQAKLEWADIVIINSEISSTARMAYKHWLSALPNAVADYCAENGKISVISSVDKPYDVQLYPNADAIVAAYGCKGSSVDVTEALVGGATGSEAAYGPNIIAAVEVILGTYGAQGTLPVNIPVYDVDSNTYTEEIAYERGYGLTYAAKETVVLVSQPSDASAAVGANVVVTFEAAGDGLTYTWYYKRAAGSAFYAAGTEFAKGNTYTIPMYDFRDGQQVYCVVTDAYGNSVQTNTVTLSVDYGSIEIITQPQDVVVIKAGDAASVFVDVTGEDLTYTWYYKNPSSAKFYKSTIAEGNVYETKVESYRDGQQLYCVITDANGYSVQTETVTLSIAVADVVITKDLEDVTVENAGDAVSLCVEAEGENLIYTWYYKNPGSSKFYKSTIGQGNKYETKVTSYRNGQQVYCVITDAAGASIQTSTATLTIAE